MQQFLPLLEKKIITVREKIKSRSGSIRDADPDIFHLNRHIIELLDRRHVAGNRSTCHTSTGHIKSNLNLKIIYFELTLKAKSLAILTK